MRRRRVGMICDGRSYTPEAGTGWVRDNRV